MGSARSAFVFQQKTNELMDGLNDVPTYLDDCLTYSKGSVEDHLKNVEAVLQRWQQAPKLSLNILIIG